MAVTTFIPEIWSAALLSALRDQLVYGQGGLVNRNYEGEVARAGDTVHVNQVGAIDVSPYVRNSTSLTYETLATTEQVITVAQSEYFAFKVDDVDRRQALPGFVEEAARNAAYSLAQSVDTHVSGVMAAGAGNDLGAVTLVAATPTDAYDLLVDMRTAHSRANTPGEGRFVVVPPEMYALLLHDDRFIRADAAGTTEGLRRGFVGRAAGFDVIEANTVPDTGVAVAPDQGAYTVISGHAVSTTFIEQIAQTEALRLESSFSDAIRGLHLYQAAVLEGRENNLVKAAVTIDNV